MATNVGRNQESEIQTRRERYNRRDWSWTQQPANSPPNADGVPGEYVRIRWPCNCAPLARHGPSPSGVHLAMRSQQPCGWCRSHAGRPIESGELPDSSDSAKSVRKMSLLVGELAANNMEACRVVCGTRPPPGAVASPRGTGLRHRQTRHFVRRYGQLLSFSRLRGTGVFRLVPLGQVARMEDSGGAISERACTTRRSSIGSGWFAVRSLTDCDAVNSKRGFAG